MGSFSGKSFRYIAGVVVVCVGLSWLLKMRRSAKQDKHKWETDDCVLWT